MGTSKSKSENVNTEFVNHPKFNEVVVVEKNNEKYIQLQMPVHSEREVLDWQRALKQLGDFNKEPLLLPQSHEFQKQGLCGSTGIVKVFESSTQILYENYPYLLTDEIYNRKGLSKLFEESEIWYLLYTAVSAAKDFQKAKIKLGDIRPQNIFINEDGQVKLTNIYSWPNEDNNYMKTVLNNEPTYIAPEEVNELKNGKHDNTCDPNLAEAFSIGLTILDAGLLGDASKLYNFKSQKFDENEAKKLFNEWANSYYSDFLKGTVLSLVELDPKNRSSPAEVYSKLQPYEDDIKNLKQFANSVQGSPNRPSDNRITPGGYPVQYRPSQYNYEGPNLVRSQLVPGIVEAADYNYGRGPAPISYNNQPLNTIAPGHTTTTYATHVGPTVYPQSPGTFAIGSYVAKPFPSGNVSTGINALNPSSYYTTSASAGSSAPYQLSYQPSTIVTSNLPTSIPPNVSNTGITSKQYEIPISGPYTSFQPISSYQLSNSNTNGVNNPITFNSGQPIYTETTGLPPSSTGHYTGGIYANSYQPTSSATNETLVSGTQPYVYNTYAHQYSDSNTGMSSPGLQSGQTTSAARLGAISTSGVGSGGISQSGDNRKEAVTTVTRIINGQPVTATDIQRVEATSQDNITNTWKDLNDARQFISAQSPNQY